MKKGLLKLGSVILLSSFMSMNLDAAEFYIPLRNTYYQRSQHTYSYKGTDGKVKNNYAPAIYTLLSDKEDVDRDDRWDFREYGYKVPWVNNDEDYHLAYCADLLIDIMEQEPYQRININSSSQISSEIKSKIIGILKNSYPYISSEEMLNNLVRDGVLVYKEINDTESDGQTKSILTSPKNESPTTSVTTDELVSAIQLAIMHYTNPDSIVDDYYKTSQLQTKTVLSYAGLWENVYKTGTYTEVENNINDIINYLFTLEDKSPEDLEINDIYVNKEADGYTLYVKLNRLVEEKSNIDLYVYEDNNLVKENKLSNINLSSDGYYVLPKLDIENENNVNVSIKGNDYITNGVYVYEATNGIEATQTLVGLDSGNNGVDLMANKVKINHPKLEENIEENPKTGLSNMTYYFGIGIILCASIVIIMLKKKNILNKI